MQKSKRFLSCLLTIALLFISILPVQKVQAAISTQRLSGVDRYETAIKISQSGWSGSQNVVLATGQDFPDALSAAPLAKKLNAPILLTEKLRLSSGVEDEIKRLGAKKVFIVGGTGVVSKSIEDRIRANSIEVIRLSGSDRYETSIAVANYMNSNFGGIKEIVAATGSDFPDALSIAPVAAKKGIPIILTPKTYLPSVVKTYISSKGITKTYLIGGSGVISEKVRQDLPDAERIWGSDRYETNVAILNRFSKELDFNKSYMATGRDFPDALAGSALAPETSSPIILVDKVPADVTMSFAAHRISSISQVTILGGEGAVPYLAVQKTIMDNIRGTSSGNIVNGGFAAEGEVWIYFANDSFDKVKVDGTERITISQDPSMFINVVGDWIYYFNAADQGKLYKMKTDGTNVTKLNDDILSIFINVAGSWVYYHNGADNGSIYKIKTDGTGRMRLNYDYSTDINVLGNWIYYSSGMYDKKLYKIRTDGTGKTEVYSSAVEYINATDSFIYYRDIIDNSKIYKIKPDGSGKTMVSSDAALFINICGDWIFYGNHSDEGKLYKIKNDGTGRAKLSDDVPITINVVGDWIYYVNDTEALLRLKTDGTRREIIN